MGRKQTEKIDDARQKLAEAQGRLVSALTDRTPAPEGFDAARVDLAARTLVNKRIQGIARAWPRLTAAMHGTFKAQLEEYFKSHPSPPPSGAAEDGRGFIGFLRSRGRLPDEGAIELIHRRLSRWPVAVAPLRKAGRIQISFRVPGLARVWNVRVYSPLRRQT